MAGRIVFELFIFSIPFIVFGLYLLATSNAQQEGKKDADTCKSLPKAFSDLPDVSVRDAQQEGK